MKSIKQFTIGFRKGMNIFAETMQELIISVFLVGIYVFGVGTMALVAKISGKHFLDIKNTWQKEAQKQTYWVEKAQVKKDRSEYYRQL